MKFLFTYGSLMRGGSNHYLLDLYGCKFMENTSVRADLVKTPYPFPAVKEGLGLVSGEMYTFPEEAIKNLDHFEGDPEFYQRRTVFTTEGILVEVYFGTGVINLKPQAETPLPPDPDSHLGAVAA